MGRVISRFRTRKQIQNRTNESIRERKKKEDMEEENKRRRGKLIGESCLFELERLKKKITERTRRDTVDAYKRKKGQREH